MTQFNRDEIDRWMSNPMRGTYYRKPDLARACQEAGLCRG